jgi:tripartite-type tricarboxylate transporter receptor subunit TctC
MKRRYLDLIFLCVALTAVVQVAWSAEKYPTKPIRMIVPFSPGGGVDLIGRLIAQKLQDAWGQSVIVDNHAGGGGNIGTGMVAKAPPDGYTILVGYVGNLAINPWLFGKLPYDSLKDFAPVCLTTTAPNLLVSHPLVPVTTVDDLVTLAKAKPGVLSYASAGNGTVGHMVAELFKSVTGANIVHVPYKGNGVAVNDLLGGHVQLMFAAPGAVLPFVESKRLTSIAVASAKRLAELPSTPTFAEAGYPRVEASGWYGILAPAGTPRPIVEALNTEIVRIMALADVRERLKVHGYAVETSSPEEFANLIKSDLTKWREVVKTSGARVD